MAGRYLLREARRYDRQAFAAEILFVIRSNENMRFFNRISQRHVDFLLCEASNMRPVLVIELDDVSHNRSARKEKDMFLDEALQAAGLPILRITARRQYSMEEVIAQLKPFLSSSRPADEPTSPESGVESQATPTISYEDNPPMCPKCSVPMVLRIASRGEHKGSRFYGCPNFPKCRQVLPVNAEQPAG